MNTSKAISTIQKILRRLESGFFTDSDIDVLFVTARELPSATKNIFEIGSFVAHKHQRDKGIINDMMQRNHLLMNILYGRDKYKVKHALNEYPKYLPLLIKLQLNMFDNEYLKRTLGLKGGQVDIARKKLNNKKSYEIKGDVCKLTSAIGVNEWKIVQEVLSALNCADSIEFNVLFFELTELLKKEIPNVDLSPLNNNKMKIAGMLMCLLNNINFSLVDGCKAKTVIRLNTEYNVYVYGQYNVIAEMEPFNEVSISTPVFHSGYAVTDLFDEHVTNENIENGDIEFCFDVGKIVAL